MKNLGSNLKLWFKKIWGFDFVVYAVCFLTLIIILFTQLDYSGKSPLIIFQFLVIGAVSFYKIVSSKKNFSLTRILYIFIFFFFFFAPLSQYLNGYVAWNVITVTDRSFIDANNIIILGIFFFELVNFLTRKKFNFKPIKNKLYISPEFLLLISVVIFIYEVVTNQIFNTTDGINYFFSPKQIDMMIRIVPIVCLFILLNEDTEKKLPYSLLMIGMLFFLFLPLGGNLSRFFLFGCYVTVLCFFFRNFKYKSILFFMFFFGFLFLFTALNFFKFHRISEIMDFRLKVNTFLSVDYDAYDLLIATMYYTKTAGYSYFNNIASSLFSFIPRSIWTNKAIESGNLIFTYMGSSWVNVSCPYIAEFYLAGGIVGVIILSALQGLVNNVLDKLAQVNIFPKMIHAFLCGMSIFILRGSLLPTLSYTYALLFGIIGMWILNYAVKLFLKANRMDIVDYALVPNKKESEIFTRTLKVDRLAKFFD